MLDNIKKLNTEYRQKIDAEAHNQFSGRMMGRLHFKRNVHHFSGWETLTKEEIRLRLMQIINEPNAEFGLIDFANFLAFAHALDYTPEDIFGEMHASLVSTALPQPMPAPPPIHGTCEEPKAKED